MTASFDTSLSILLVDDDPAWLRGLKHSLALALHTQVLVCDDSREALACIASKNPAVALLDVTMPYLDGETLLASIREEHPTLPVIMLTGRNQVDIAVRCMRLGAFDYCLKTDELERIIGSVRNALHRVELERQNLRLRNKMLGGALSHPEHFAKLLTRDRIMHGIFRYLEAIAESQEPLLLCGESGTGKELIARAFHQLTAPDAPFVAVNVAGLDDQMFSDTLFGHRRGAFTGAFANRAGLFEQAGEGLLFLDEIGDLCVASQVKLLRLLQEREFLPLGSDRAIRSRCRIVCATNRALEQGLGEGWFRKDLYYRLRTHQVVLPALRERRADIPLLLRHFWNETGGPHRKSFDTLPSDIVALLVNYDYPGNVRELRGIIIDIAHRIDDPDFSVASMPKLYQIQSAPADVSTAGFETPLFGSLVQIPTLKDADRQLVDAALARSDGNQAQAARMLGISRAALNKRLKNRGN